MNIKPMKKYSIKNYSRIGKILPKYRLTLLTGLPGTGKSFSLLKFLNKYNILPILFNLDEDAELAKFDTTGITSNKKILKKFINLEITDIKKEDVIVIDTYARFCEILKLNTHKTKTQHLIADILLKTVKYYGCTVIVVGHPADYVGKDSIFKDNPALVRNCHEHLHLDSVLPRGKTNTGVFYRLFIKKGRGIGGTQIIDNWMRSDKQK